MTYSKNVKSDEEEYKIFRSNLIVACKNLKKITSQNQIQIIHQFDVLAVRYRSILEDVKRSDASANHPVKEVISTLKKLKVQLDKAVIRSNTDAFKDTFGEPCSLLVDSLFTEHNHQFRSTDIENFTHELRTAFIKECGYDSESFILFAKQKCDEFFVEILKIFHHNKIVLPTSENQSVLQKNPVFTIVDLLFGFARFNQDHYRGSDPKKYFLNRLISLKNKQLVIESLTETTEFDFTVRVEVIHHKNYEHWDEDIHQNTINHSRHRIDPSQFLLERLQKHIS
jgi:CRISPR/Cas system CSM-associated protein Csm2 small subunit